MKRNANLPARAALLGILLTVLADASADSQEDTAVHYGAWPLPSLLISEADPGSEDGARRPKPGFQRWEGTASYDAKELLTSLGISFPEGAQAFCTGRLLTVRNTRRNLDRLDKIFASQGPGDPRTNLLYDFAIYECALPESNDPFLPSWPTYADLMRLAKDARILRDRISGTALNLYRTSIKNVATTKTSGTSNSSDPAEDFLPGESGFKIEWEGDMRYSENAISNLIDFRWRAKSGGEAASTLHFNTSFGCLEGRPQVLNVSPSLETPGRYLVTTCVVRIVPAAEWTLEKLQEAAAALEP